MYLLWLCLVFIVARAFLWLWQVGAALSLQCAAAYRW